MTSAELFALAQAQDSSAQTKTLASQALESDLLNASRARAITNLNAVITQFIAARTVITDTTASTILLDFITFWTNINTDLTEGANQHATIATGGTRIITPRTPTSSVTALNTSVTELNASINIVAQAAVPKILRIIALANTITSSSLWAEKVVLTLTSETAYATPHPDQYSPTARVRIAQVYSAWAAAQQNRNDGLT